MLKVLAASKSFVGVLRSMSEKRVLAACGSGEEVENLTPEALRSVAGQEGLVPGEKLVSGSSGCSSGEGLGGSGALFNSSTSSMHCCRMDFSTRVILWMERMIRSMSETGEREIGLSGERKREVRVGIEAEWLGVEVEDGEV